MNPPLDRPMREWTSAELAEELRSEAHGACDNYMPDHNGECLQCDEAYIDHVTRAAVDRLAEREP